MLDLRIFGKTGTIKAIKELNKNGYKIFESPSNQELQEDWFQR